MAAGAVSLKLPNFLTTSQDVTKGADQAIYVSRMLDIYFVCLGYLIVTQNGNNRNFLKILVNIPVPKY